MANRQLGEMIEQLKQEKDAPVQAASLIALLEAKQEELREDATPEQVAQTEGSYTGQYLKKVLKAKP